MAMMEGAEGRVPMLSRLTHTVQSSHCHTMAATGLTPRCLTLVFFRWSRFIIFSRVGRGGRGSQKVFLHSYVETPYEYHSLIHLRL
jgi:hypothetical protein